MKVKVAVLHLLNGEQIELTEAASESIRSVLKTDNQSLHGSMIHEGDYSYPMWSVVKIEWRAIERR